MKISVITPTSERVHFLKGCYELLKKQQELSWEWLIYDSSLRPVSFNDDRICYFHDDTILSIGEKRNRLAERATGDCIVHIDDDDYYAPNYLKLVTELLQKAAFSTLHSWFCYDTKNRQFYYQDTNYYHEMRYEVSPLSKGKIRELYFSPEQLLLNSSLNLYSKKGYGFSYAYHREVAQKCSFKDLDFAEDRHFYESVEAAGFPIITHGGQKGEVVHVIHETNSSTEYPQYRIPNFLMEPLIASFFSYLKETYEN